MFPGAYLKQHGDKPAIIMAGSGFTQTYAEHSATPPIKPERSTIGIDTVGCADDVRTIDGSPRFAFVRALLLPRHYA